MSDWVKKNVDAPIQDWLADAATEGQKNWADSRQENIDWMRQNGHPGIARSAWWHLKGWPSEIRADISDALPKYRDSKDLDSVRDARYQAEKDQAMREYLNRGSQQYSPSPWKRLKRDGSF